MTDIGDFYEPASAQRTACRKAIVNRVDVFVYAKRSARFCVIEYLIPGEHPGSRKLHRHLRLIEEDEEEYKVATHIHKGDEIKLSFDDEFEEFFYDYTRWSLNKFLPRVSSVMEPFRDFQLNLSHRGIGEVAAAFSKPEIRKAIQKLWEIDDFYQVYRKKLAAANEELAELGFPSMMGGRAVVPFDKYSDTYRGMELTFVDIFEDENLVMKFCNKFHKEQIEQLRHGNPDGKKTGKQIVMALHKGSDDMMSNAFYEKFYWNHLKEIIAACREAGMMANVFCEGMYNDKLKYLAEVEKGSAYFTFDKVNMQKAKKTVGSVCCIGGGFPTPLLVYETPEKVREAVKRHLDVAMPDGGYIFRMSAGLDGAKAENVEAMFETVHEYGKYR